jgi:hypothetical protein
VERELEVGLLGLGNVGRSLLLQYSLERHRFKISWIADSKHFLTKKDRKPFDKKDVRKIIALKNNALKKSVEPAYEEHVSGCQAYDFDNLANEISVIRDLTSGKLRHSVVLDATSSSPQADYAVAQNLMGCVAYCTGNKTPWADYEFCLSLYREARRRCTLLGLNCTLGVWLDQMEVLPLVVQAFETGEVQFLKRDNSSFNTFFAKVGSGITARRAMMQLEASGHLEKTGPGALSREVKDQGFKASIVANICGILRGEKPHKSVSLKFHHTGPDSLNAPDVARWHVEGRKLGKYRALVSDVYLNTRCVHWEVSFMELPNRHPLSRDFPEKCAMFVQPHEDAKFHWSKNVRSNRSRGFAYSGYGGAARTAAKLLWEVERAISLSDLPLNRECLPLPVLCSLAAGQRDAVTLRKRLARSLA